MARLDNVIERMFKETGSEISFETGGGITLNTRAGAVPVIKNILTTPQIVGAITEILPPDLRDKFPKDGATRFSYRSPFGVVAVVFQLSGGKAQAQLSAQPSGASDEAVAPLAAAAPPKPARAEIGAVKIAKVPNPVSNDPSETMATLPETVTGLGGAVSCARAGRATARMVAAAAARR